LLRKLRRSRVGRALAGVQTTNLVQRTGQKGGAQMNGKGSLATGVALALMLGMGLTATVPAVGLRTASAQDQALAADQFFIVNWTASPAALGESRISGYVYNNYGDAADQVQLRITEFDPSGQPIATFIKLVDEIVPAFDQAYFDVLVPGQAASYRVAVESFNFLQGTE
jgi:hypothetical protein